MSSGNLILALALMLLFEGLGPLLAPRQWRELFQRVSQLRDGQIRFIGLAAVVGAALLLLSQ